MARKELLLMRKKGLSGTFFSRHKGIKGLSKSIGSFVSGADSIAYTDLVLSLSPIAYWRLGESAGTTSVDDIGGYNGTYIGAYTLGSASLISSDATDTSVAFTVGRVQVPHNAALNFAADYTVNFFLKFTSTSYGVIVSKVQGAQPFAGLGIGTNVTTGNVTATNKNEAAYQLVTTVGGLNDGVERMYTVVRRGLDLEIWINGSLSISKTMPGVEVFTTTENLTFMDYVVGTQPTNGTLDEVAMYNKALTPSEIASLYSASA